VGSARRNILRHVVVSWREVDVALELELFRVYVRDVGAWRPRSGDSVQKWLTRMLIVSIQARPKEFWSQNSSQPIRSTNPECVRCNHNEMRR
jgi:hypothetical protein